MTYPTIPEWLRPHKDRWLSAGMLRKLMMFNGPVSLGTWLPTVAPRLRSVQVRSRSNKLARLYLVKQVWTFARVHGFDIRPGEYATPLEEQMAAVLAANERLRLQVTSQTMQIAELSEKLALKGSARETLAAALYGDMALMALRATEAKALPGVYFLLDDDLAIVYVGQSQNVLVRMAGHLEKAFRHVRMIHIEDQVTRLQVETKFIAILQPPLNVTGIRPGARAA